MDHPKVKSGRHTSGDGVYHVVVLPADFGAQLSEIRFMDFRRGVLKRKQFQWYSLCFSVLHLVVLPNLSDVVAQQQPVLTGSVVDSRTMTPVAGAVVVLAGTLHGSLTRSDGYFEFFAVSQGEYRLIVSAEGYTVFQKSIRMQDDLHLDIRLISKMDELPDKHSFLGQNGGLATRMYKGLLPRRVNAIQVQYTLYEAPLNPTSLYLDGVRLIDPFMPILALAEIEQTEVVPSPYNPDLGMDASIHYQTSDRNSTDAQFMYDSRKRGSHSRLTLHRDWARIHGTLSGSYESANNYSDGSSGVQHAGLHLGNIAGRTRIRIAPGHALSGSGGWTQYVHQSGGRIQQQAAMMQYKYERNTGFLQAVTVSTALQGLEGGLDIVQQSGATSIRLMPSSSLRLKVGADYYHYTKKIDSLRSTQQDDYSNPTIETGLFMEATHRISPFLIEGRFRLDPTNHQWGGAALLTWLISNDWRLLVATGRGRSTGKDSSVRQADIGVRWNGFENSVELMTFVRGAKEAHTFGITASIRGSWWSTALYTAMLDSPSQISKSQLSTWMRVYMTFTGPFELFTLRSEAYGTLFNSSTWISAGLWIESREIGGVSLRIGLHNLFNGTYTYPHSEFAEPGRSFQFGLSYQRK